MDESFLAGFFLVLLLLPHAYAPDCGFRDARSRVLPKSGTREILNVGRVLLQRLHDLLFGNPLLRQFFRRTHGVRRIPCLMLRQKRLLFREKDALGGGDDLKCIFRTIPEKVIG